MNTTRYSGLEFTMRRPMLLAVLLMAALMFLMFGCGDDKTSDNDDDNGDTSVPITGALVVPPGWGGDWEMELTFGDCESDKVYAINSYTYTMGVGDTMKVNICPILEECVGVASGDSIVFSCYDTFVEGTCTAFAIVELGIALESDSIVGEGEWTITTSGDCGDDYYIAGCEDIAVAGSIGP